MVQEKINRVQNTDFIVSLINRAKTLAFQSINIDLIYGLPKQDKHTLLETMAKVKEMAPDRISLFSYAHMPNLFKTHFKVCQIENSILFLTCDSAKLMTRFRMIQDQTISKLNDLISPQKIISIKIKIRPNGSVKNRQVTKQFHRQISKKMLRF